MKKSTARLIIADSERNADLYYATRFIAPDPFVYFEIEGRRTLLMSDLEIDRARAQAGVDEVLSLSVCRKALPEKQQGLAALVAHLLLERDVRRIEVPSSQPAGIVEALRGEGLTVSVCDGAFFPQRVIKRPEEVEAIEQAVRSTERAVTVGLDALRRSKVNAQGKLVLDGELLSAERLRFMIHVELLRDNCLGQHTIIACGEQSVDPHNQGSGPLYANRPIILDVFPQHTETRYFADMTRTVVKGKASEALKLQYQAVYDAQQMAIERIRPGADGKEIHEAIHVFFESRGFKTGTIDGRMQGFFHGTGHGVGVEIHEAPRIGGLSDILEEGMVVTVEPGLYYAGTGGVRIEDIVLVTENNCRNLNQLEKVLELE